MLGRFISPLIFRTLEQKDLTFFMTHLSNFEYHLLKITKPGRAENFSNIIILTYERNSLQNVNLLCYFILHCS